MKIARLSLLLSALFILPEALVAREAPKSVLPSYESWDDEVVHTFENILVQEGGRVKPIYTIARFTLMQFSGKTSLK